MRGTPASDRHYVSEILLKVTLKTIAVTHGLLYHFMENKTYKHTNTIFRLLKAIFNISAHDAFLKYPSSGTLKIKRF